MKAVDVLGFFACEAAVALGVFNAVLSEGYDALPFLLITFFCAVYGVLNSP